MTAVIERVHAREVFDSKGLPTIEVEIRLENGSMAKAAAPGGTSRGKGEAFDLRDGDLSEFNGLGVKKAIRNVNTEIADRLRGRDATHQEEIDRLLIDLDGTGNKSRLGGNTIIATSIANAKAAALAQGVPLFEWLGGGHEIPLLIVYVMFGGPAFVGLPGVCDFQEYDLIPLSAEDVKQAFVSSYRIQKRLAERLAREKKTGVPKYAKIAGMLTAQFDSNEDAFRAMTEAIEEEGFVPGKDFGIYTDIAANELYREGRYHLRADGKVLTRGDMIDLLEELCHRFPILCMEDCLYEEDWEGWRLLTERLGHKVQLVGDDLFVTSRARLVKGVEGGVANGLVIKPNQVGTLTETLETIEEAKKAHYGTIISIRSGELWDPYLVHLCVGQNLGQGKIVGAYATGEANVNELLRVEDHLGNRAFYRGNAVLSRFLGDGSTASENRKNQALGNMEQGD
jgi:enolase